MVGRFILALDAPTQQVRGHGGDFEWASLWSTSVEEIGDITGSVGIMLVYNPEVAQQVAILGDSKNHEKH